MLGLTTLTQLLIFIYINKKINMKSLIISGETLQQTEWNVEDILSKIPQSTKDTFEKLEFQEQYLNRQENIYKHSLTLTSR